MRVALLWLALALALGAACRSPLPPLPDDASTYSDCVADRTREGCSQWP